MNRTQIGVLAGITAVLGMALQTVPTLIIGRWTDGSMPPWVPTFGSLGRTVVIYSTLIDILVPLLTIGLAVGLGYYVGTSSEFREKYRRVTGLVAVSSTVGVVIVWVILMWFGASYSSFDVFTALIFIGALTKFLVSVSLTITVGALAGVAVVTFHDNSGRGRVPTTDNPNSTS